MTKVNEWAATSFGSPEVIEVTLDPAASTPPYLRPTEKQQYIWLAGPEHKGTRALEEAAGMMRRKGLFVVAGHEQVRFINDPAETGRERLRSMLSVCNAMALMIGWEHNAAAQLERRVAMDLGWPVRLVGGWMGFTAAHSKE